MRSRVSQAIARLDHFSNLRYRSTFSMRIGRSLSPGHPDRACDILAETIVDEYLRRDPTSSLRVHVMGGRGALFVTGVVSSKADFDVGAVLTRTAAALGTRQPLEPFVALESIPGGMLLEATRSARPIVVIGYATHETDEQIPSAAVIARRITQKLESLRHDDPEWYWLEPAFDVSVLLNADQRPTVIVSCAHGERDLAHVRDDVTRVARSIVSEGEIRVNIGGPIAVGGLDHDIGASGVQDDVYGSGIIGVSSPIGLDPSHPKKFGTWLARSLARRALLRSDARAVMVTATYHAGDAAPMHVRIRDEKGNDLAEPQDADALTYRELARHYRHGLNSEAARWGFAGVAGFPWEE
jgi:S-adenosylmethionine synthetase